MGNDRISKDSPGQGSSSNYQLPSNIENKAALDRDDYINIYLKNESPGSFLSAKIFRTIRILLANDETKTKWATYGTNMYTAYKEFKDITSSDSKTKTIGGEHFNTTNPEVTKLPDKREEELSIKTELQQTKNNEIVQQIFPNIDLTRLSLSQLKNLLLLVKKIGETNSSKDNALLLQVIQHKTSTNVPDSLDEVEQILEEFQTLNAFRKKVGNLVFVASNWRDSLNPGERSNDLIDKLEANLTKNGWANCLDQFMKHTENKKDAKIFLHKFLTNEQLEGRSFDPEGENEKTITSLLSTCNEFPGLLDDLLKKMSSSETHLASHVTSVTEEIKKERLIKAINELKAHFNSALHPMINNYYQARFPSLPSHLSEIPAPQDLMKELLQFEIKSEHQKVFADAFSPFFPKNTNQVTPQLILTLAHTAQLGHALIEKYGYDSKDVATGCFTFLKAQEQRNEVLKAPNDAKTLNNFLLTLLPPQKDWQQTLVKEIGANPGEFTSKLALELANKLPKQVQPRNQDEIEAITTLLAIGNDFHNDLNYPLEALAKGITDYLTEQRQRNEPLSAPFFGFSNNVLPYCNRYLKALPQWDEKLWAQVPATQQSFCSLLIQQINQEKDLTGPINLGELKALEKFVEVGAKIAGDNTNAYDEKHVANACTNYLKQMRAERKPFTLLSGFGGLTSNLAENDLYPLCLNSLLQSLLLDNPDQKKITTLLMQTIKDPSVPLNAKGRQLLETLVRSMASKEFAQGKGVNHVAVAAKFATILSDLKLSSVPQLNHSKIPPERFEALFNHIQQEQFALPSVNEVIEEIRLRPIHCLKTLTKQFTTILMGASGQATLNEPMNTLIDKLVAKDFSSTVEMIQKQLNKLANKLSITESANVNVSIHTLGITGTLKREVQQIQIPFKRQKIVKALQNLQSHLEKDAAIKKYQSFKSGERNATEQEEYKALCEDPAIKHYEIFLELKDKILIEQSNETRKELIQKLIQNLHKILEPSSKTGIFSFLGEKESAEFNIKDSLNVLEEELKTSNQFTIDSLDSFGLLGGVIKQGVSTLADIQAQRNEGTYANEPVFTDLSTAINVIEKKLVTKLASAVLTSPRIISMGISIAMSILINSTQKAIKKAENAGNKKYVEQLTAQLSLFTNIKDNSQEIAKVITPIVKQLQKNHQFVQHKTLFEHLKKIIQDPNYVIDENETLMLTGQIADSVEVLLNEIEKNYAHFFEDLTESILTLPNQTKKAPPIAIQPLSIWSSSKKSLGNKEQEYATHAMLRLQNMLAEEYPLKEEIQKKAAKKAEERKSEASNDWLTMSWNRFANAVAETAQETIDSMTDYSYNNKIFDVSSFLKLELLNHPFLANNFDDVQLHELHSLIKEAVTFQTNTAFSSEVIGIACRLFIEREVDEQGRLNIPLISLNEASTADKLAYYCFLATIEQSIREAKLPYGRDPYFIESVTALITQEISPSYVPLNKTGRENLSILTKIIADPGFADGKPVVLPTVQAQFKNMFPHEFDTVEALNASAIPKETQELFSKKSSLLMKRKIDLGLLRENLLQHPAQAITLLTHPFVDNLIGDKATAREMKQAMSSFTFDLERSKKMDLILEKLNGLLERAGILRAVQVEINISPRQIPLHVRHENSNLKTFMKKEGRLPISSEAKSMGLTTPFLCKVVGLISTAKDTQNKTNTPISNDLSNLHEGLKYLKTILRFSKDSPLVLLFLEKALPSVIKFGLELQMSELKKVIARTEEQEKLLILLEFLLEENNIERLSFFLTHILTSVIQRHDFTKYENVIDQLIKIFDPENKNGVNKIELAEVLINATNVFLDEIDVYYSDIIPDLLNVFKSIQFLEQESGARS